jgi:2-(1,2-epoxy-1,2-dihydrophenyl)acetyl-CoA isomerase
MACACPRVRGQRRGGRRGRLAGHGLRHRHCRAGASFIQAFSKIGLVPDAGGTWLLPQRVGLARAMALAMTGDKLPGAQAKAMGHDLGRGRRLPWPPPRRWLKAPGRHAHQGAGGHARLLRGAHTHSLDEQLDLERDVQSRLGFTHDYIEGVTAFLQKRPAQFKANDGCSHFRS